MLFRRSVLRRFKAERSGNRSICLFKLSLPPVADGIDRGSRWRHARQPLRESLNRFPARVGSAAHLNRFESGTLDTAQHPAIHGTDMQPLTVRPWRKESRHVAEGN